jgi:hypothetical protein
MCVTRTERCSRTELNLASTNLFDQVRDEQGGGEHECYEDPEPKLRIVYIFYGGQQCD